jgi:hypothetical protein
MDREKRSMEAHSGFYLTLVSIMQSLALGYLLQLVGGQLISSGRISALVLFQSITSLTAIVLVWHQYAMGTIAYSWKLGMRDSTIPFIIGITEYSMVSAIAFQRPEESRFALWLWSVVAFAIVATVAYWNQYDKAALGRGRNGDTGPRKSMLCTGGYCVGFCILAILHTKWPFQARLQSLVSLAVAIVFVVEYVRVSRRELYADAPEQIPEWHLMPGGAQDRSEPAAVNPGTPKLSLVAEAGTVSANEMYRFLGALYLHQDQMGWSRTQTLVAIEAGVLAAAFYIKWWLSPLILGLGTVLVWWMFALIRRDWQVRKHVAGHLDSVHRTYDFRLIPREIEPGAAKGKRIVTRVRNLLIVVNCVLIVLRLLELLLGATPESFWRRLLS